MTEQNIALILSSVVLLVKVTGPRTSSSAFKSVEQNSCSEVMLATNWLRQRNANNVCSGTHLAMVNFHCDHDLQLLILLKKGSLEENHVAKFLALSIEMELVKCS